MTTESLLQDVYDHRLRACRNEKYSTPQEFTKELENILTESGIGYTKNQLRHLTYAGNDMLPIISLLPVAAKCLDVSIGYLFGQHDIREMKTESVRGEIRFNECEREYKKTHGGRTLLGNKILHPQWYSKIKKDRIPPQKIRPYLRIAEALDWDIDYILGVSTCRSWKYFCIDNNELDAIPEQTLIKTCGEYALLNKEKDGFLLKSGELLTAKEIKKAGYEIINKTYPL